jgi:hypothetical protein
MDMKRFFVAVILCISTTLVSGAAGLTWSVRPVAGKQRTGVSGSRAQPRKKPVLRGAPQSQPTSASPASQPYISGDGKRFKYTPRPYPVDDRGFSPVDKVLAKAYAREEVITDDAEGSLNPYVMKIVNAYPLEKGVYPYHCSWTPREYDIYNGVTQDMYFKGLVVAKAYPDGSRCSYCCGFTFEVFVRAMKLRNIQKGLDPDDFNGMTFNDLFNMLQLWYIEGKGDCVRNAIVDYGLGRPIENNDEARAGDFGDYSTTKGGHSVIFIDWLRDASNKIVGMKYFSSNLSGTEGVGYGEGHFSDSTPEHKGIIRTSLRLARVVSIKDYKPFDRLKIPQRNAYAPSQPNRLIYVPMTQPASG